MRRCQNCGLVFTWPLPEMKTVTARYNREWFIKEYLPSFEVDPDAPSLEHLDERFARLFGVIGKLRQNNRMLDVGAGAGIFLWHARKNNWEPFGVEISEFGPAYAKQHFSLDITRGTLSDVDFPEGYFDVIVLQDVLEHVVDPEETFRTANRLLRVGGAIVLQTPNYAGLSRLLLRENWGAISPAEHLSLFSPRSLEALSRRTGFSVSSFLPTLCAELNSGVHDLAVPFTRLRRKVLELLYRFTPAPILNSLHYQFGDELSCFVYKEKAI
jgi:2-polyprenyl-3-methyl-5-hydroxy-6-metoxy-1,4-benzoquinol methylase